MKYLKLLILLSFTFLWAASESYSDKFINLSFGTGYGHVKDQGTSPLRYHGSIAQANASYLKEKDKNTFELLFNISGMMGLASMNSLNYFSGALDINYMHDLPFFKNNRVDLRLGADLNIGLKGLYSPAYQNAAFNLDMMVKFAISSRFSYTFDIHKQQIKIAGIYFNIREQKYTPYIKIDLPALTFNGRPEYPYVNENDLGIFDRHYFFGGLPICTELGIKKHLPNGNIIGLAYDWEIFSSGHKDIYLFESGFHQLLLSLHFKLN